MANITIAAPAQHSQPSRKSKRTWRKNVDLTEINQGLEQVRSEIIQGGLVTELPSDALFTTDTAGSSRIREKYVSRHKLLKSDEILAQRSAVPAVASRKRAASDLGAEGLEKKHKKDGVSHREYLRLRNIAYGGDSTHKAVVRNDEDASFDPWNTPVLKKPKEFSFLEEKKPVKAPPTLKHKPVSMAVNERTVKAVRTPAAEKSYNPTFDDWAARLDREGTKEVAKEQARLDAQAEEAERQRKIAEAQQQEEEMKQWDSEWESEWDGIASENEQTPEWLNKKRPERKTQAQRNKNKRRREAEAEKQHKEKIKQREQQAERIRTLAKEAELDEKLRVEKAAEKAHQDTEDSSDDGEDVAVRQKLPFGKAPIPGPPLEVLLVEDLPDSLRRLKPEGNILHDRYRSLLLRGKVESRKAQQKKAKMNKYTEKWSYKDWKLA